MGDELDYGDDAVMEVIELRRYFTKPDRRDELIALFEREFIESQEACGMVPIGHYRDLDDANSFVWIRGFPDMVARERSLKSFYLESPAWRDNRNAANDTMADSDNVLLLKPAAPTSGFDLIDLKRPNLGSSRAAEAYLAVGIFMLTGPADDAIATEFEEAISQAVEPDKRRIAYYITESRENRFPKLPIREGEPSLIIATVCRDLRSLNHFICTLQEQSHRAQIRSRVLTTECLRLLAANRCLLR